MKTSRSIFRWVLVAVSLAFAPSIRRGRSLPGDEKPARSRWSVRRQEPRRLEEDRVVQGGRGEGRGRCDRPRGWRADGGRRQHPEATCRPIDYDLTFEARRTTGEDFFAAATFPWASRSSRWSTAAGAGA